MRNFFKLFFALALVLSISACAGPRPGSDTPGTNASGLIFSTYDAADRLIEGSQVPLDPAKPVIVTKPGRHR